MPRDMRKVLVESLRWYLLQALHFDHKVSYADAELHYHLNADDLPITLQDVQRQLSYLEQRKLLTLDRSDPGRWKAKLTALGIDVVEYTVDVHPGIARPLWRG